MRPVTVALLTAILIAGSSFKLNNTDLKAKSAFTATLDGKALELNTNRPIKGVVVNRAGSGDSKAPQRIIISAIYKEASFTENLQFELDYKPNSIGVPSFYSISLIHENAMYEAIKEGSNVSITSITWEDDKKHFLLSVDFDCKLRGFKYPFDGLKEMSLKGKMTDIRVTVPESVSQ